MFLPVNGDQHRNSVSLHLPMTGANNSTTFTDFSLTPKTITRNGDAKISTAQSKWGQGSGLFDGNGDYLGEGFNAAYKIEGDFTVEAWVYLLSDTGGVQTIASFYGISTASDSQWLFYYNKTTKALGFDFRCSDGTYEGHTVVVELALTTWHYLSGVRSGNNVLLFANGALLATIAQSKTIGNPTAAKLGIGALNLATPTAFLHGYLQDLRITKDIARYTANFTPPASPLPYRLPELPVQRVIQQPSFQQIARLGL